MFILISYDPLYLFDIYCNVSFFISNFIYLSFPFFVIVSLAKYSTILIFQKNTILNFIDLSYCFLDSIFYCLFGILYLHYILSEDFSPLNIFWYIGYSLACCLISPYIWIFHMSSYNSLSFIPLWIEKILNIISIFLNLFRLVLWPNIWFILENVSFVLEILYSPAFGYTVL